MRTKALSQTGWHRPVQLACGILLAGLLTGCVEHWQRVNLTLKPKVDAPLRSEPTASIVLGPFKDSRLDATWFLLLSKENIPNLFKPTEWAYLETNSVAGVLRDGVAEGLGQNGFKTFHRPATAGEPNEINAERLTFYELRGNIQSAGCRNIQRLFARSIIQTWLTVRFDLVDKAGGRTVWNDTFTGQDMGTNRSGGEFLATAFANASDDLIRQLISDRNFRSYFEP